MLIVLVLCLTIVSVVLDVNALPIDADDANAPALWAFIDGTRTILLSNQIDPTERQNIEYRWARDYYNTQSKYVKPATWTAIQMSEKRDVRHADNVTITKSTQPSFPSFIFSNFFQVTQLGMSHQTIDILRMADFEHASHLVKLNLSYNSIETLAPYTFNHAKQLQVIDLSHNAIASVSGEIFVGDKLQELYLNHNNLTYIELAWLDFDVLKVLTLNDNQLLSMDFTPSPHQTKFGSKHFFTSFDLSNNPLAMGTADAMVMHAATVKISNINVNECFIPADVSTFVASHNRIERVLASPATEGRSANFTLFELDLANNSLASLVNLTAFHRLQRLDVSNNRLTTLTAPIFQHMRRLQWLNVAHNQLANIDFGFLRSTTAITYLDISYNSMFFFRLNTITVSMEELHVEGNNLTRIDLNLRRMAPSLVRIGLNDNDWECNYLMTAVMLLQFDDIVPVINRTIDDQNDAYEDNIKGIGCHPEPVQPIAETNAFISELASLGNTTANTTVNELEQKFKKLESQLINAINAKFIETVFRLNETYNELLHR